MLNNYFKTIFSSVEEPIPRAPHLVVNPVPGPLRPGTLKELGTLSCRFRKVSSVDIIYW